MSAPLELLLENRFYCDRIVYFTDSESWFDHLVYGRGTSDLWKDYKKQVNSNAHLYVVMLLPYKHKAVRSEPGVFEIFGWSDAVLRYIVMQESATNILDVVKSTNIGNW